MNLSKLSLVLVLLCAIFQISAEVIELQIDLDAQTANYAALPLNDNSVVVIEVLENGLQYTRKFKDSRIKKNQLIIDNYNHDSKIYASLISDSEIAVVLTKTNANVSDYTKLLISTNGELIQSFPMFSLSTSNNSYIKNDFDDFFIVDGADLYYFKFREESYPQIILNDFYRFISKTSLVAYVDDSRFVVCESNQNDYFLLDLDTFNKITFNDLSDLVIDQYDIKIYDDIVFDFVTASSVYSYMYQSGVVELTQQINEIDHLIQKNPYSPFDQLAYDKVHYMPLGDTLISINNSGILEVNDSCKLLAKKYMDQNSYLLVLTTSSAHVLLLNFNTSSNVYTLLTEFSSTFLYESLSNFTQDEENIYFELCGGNQKEAIFLPIKQTDKIERYVTANSIFVLTLDPKTNYMIFTNPDYSNAESSYYHIQNALIIEAGQKVTFYGVDYAN